MTPTPQIPLTPGEQHDLTIALALEEAGFVGAADWLRKRIVRLRPVWTPTKEERLAKPHINPDDMFSHHRGSKPPHIPTPMPRVETHSKPAIRPDQTVA